MIFLSYGIAVLTLVLWFGVKENSKWVSTIKILFLLAFLSYLISTFFLDSVSAMNVKVGLFAKDLLILGGIGAVFALLKRRQPLFWFAFAGLFIFLVTYHFNNRFEVRETPASYSIEEEAYAIEEAVLSTTLDPEGELLVDIRAGEQIENLLALAAKYNLSAERAFYPANPDVTELDDYYVVNVPDEWIGQLDVIKADLMATGLLDALEDNEQILLDPRETESTTVLRNGNKFGMNDPGLGNLWGFEAMKVDELYNYLSKNNIKAKEKARIAILDTGVDAKHEDIKDKYVSTKSKYDDDPRAHGTHCAGIAASVSNNGIGIASFSPDNTFVEVTSIKVLSSYGIGTQKSIIDGMIEAADSGADVISMSLGGRSSDARQRAYAKAVEYCNKAGIVVVVAAGNSNMNAKDYSPANTPGVITVSALDEQLNRAIFSNFVTDVEMGIAAPGVNIYSTVPDSKYATFSGTSMATPYVAGLVGMLKSLNPDLTTQEVYTILKSTGKPTKDDALTGRLIQPGAAVKMLVEKKKKVVKPRPIPAIQ